VKGKAELLSEVSGRAGQERSQGGRGKMGVTTNHGVGQLGKEKGVRRGTSLPCYSSLLWRAAIREGLKGLLGPSQRVKQEG